MYKRVSGLTFWLLNIVTCGIYGIVVYYNMTSNLNAMADKVGEKHIPNYIVALLLGCVTCGIYSIVWQFQFLGLANRLNDKANAGVSPSGTFMMFLMSLIPIYSFFWLADMNNKLADAYERK